MFPFLCCTETTKEKKIVEKTIAETVKLVQWLSRKNRELEHHFNILIYCFKSICSTKISYICLNVQVFSKVQ